MANDKEILNNIWRGVLAINLMTIVGSILSFIVFSRKAFQKSSIRIYCRALAIFDLYVIFNLSVDVYSQISGVQLIASNSYVCKVSYFLTDSFTSVQGWILVVFSVDQLIDVSMTKRFAFYKKHWFQYALIIGVFIFHCGLYSQVFVLVTNLGIKIGNTVSYSCDTLSLALPIVYFIECSLLPFIILLISSSLILRILIRSRRRTGLGTSNSDSSFTRRIRDLKFAFNSVVLNAIFIIFTTPLVVRLFFPKTDFVTGYYINNILSLFFYLNYALHFWVHLSFNSIFRNEFLILLRIKKRRVNFLSNTTGSRSRK